MLSVILLVRQTWAFGLQEASFEVLLNLLAPDVRVFRLSSLILVMILILLASKVRPSLAFLLRLLTLRVMIQKLASSWLTLFTLVMLVVCLQIVPLIILTLTLGLSPFMMSSSRVMT